MPEPTPHTADEQDLVREAIHRQVNRALERGAGYALVLGLVAVLGLGAALLTSRAVIWRLPALFLLGCSGFALLLWLAARRGRVVGVWRYLLMLPFVSLPTGYFLLAEWLYPLGAASVITGAFSYAYLFLVAVTGFLLSFRVSFISGLVAAAGYLGCYLLAQPALAAVQTADPVLHDALSSLSVAGFRALAMVGTGAAVGGVGLLSRRLLLRTLDEQRRRETLQRLFGQYVSGVVSERILEQAAAAGGERVEVVILFSDLRGFSTFSEGQDPAVVVERLNGYLERMVAAIEAEGGVVDKFIGDAIMAVFGGLVQLDNPCGSAVRAARGMRRNLEALNAEWRAAGIEGFDNGIGIHVGDVLQGPIGSQHRKEFTAIGDTVNTAARLEELTKSKQEPILISEAVHARLDSGLQASFRALGEVAVKGKQLALAIYGERPADDPA